MRAQHAQEIDDMKVVAEAIESRMGSHEVEEQKAEEERQRVTIAELEDLAERFEKALRSAE